MLDPQQERREFESALRDYENGARSLSDLRNLAEAIVDRWRDPSNEKPPFTPAEVPLWNVVWEVTIGCRESLGPGGVAALRSILDGSVKLNEGGVELRP